MTGTAPWSIVLTAFAAMCLWACDDSSGSRGDSEMGDVPHIDTSSNADMGGTPGTTPPDAQPTAGEAASGGTDEMTVPEPMVGDTAGTDVTGGTAAEPTTGGSPMEEPEPMGGELTEEPDPMDGGIQGPDPSPGGDSGGDSAANMGGTPASAPATGGTPAPEPDPPTGGTSTQGPQVIEPPACEADLLTDSEHCGECWHNCLGTACVSGRCAPTTLADGLTAPKGIGVYGDHVYWVDSDDGTLSRVPKSGGAIEVLTNISGNALEMAVDGSGAYWADFRGQAIGRVDLNGNNAEILTNTADMPRGVTLSETHVYWGTQTDGIIAGQPKGGGEPTILSNYPSWVEILAVHGAYIYWAEKLSGVIRRVALDGSTMTENIVRSDQSEGHSYYGLAVNDMGIYWTDNETGDILTATHDGSDVLVLATDQGSPFRIAAAGGHVYWTNNRGGAVMATRATGGPLVVMAAAGADPAEGEPRPSAWGIATDDEWVYWSSAQGIHRVARLFPLAFEAPDPCTLCNDGNPCTTDSCVDEQCVNEPMADGRACISNNACVPSATCQGGQCEGAATETCDDQIICTEDTCDPARGCVQTPVLSCGDGSCGNPYSLLISSSTPLIEVALPVSTFRSFNPLSTICPAPPGSARYIIQLDVETPGQLAISAVNDPLGSTQLHLELRDNCTMPEAVCAPPNAGLLGNVEAGPILVVVTEWLGLFIDVSQQNWNANLRIEFTAQ